MATYLDFLTATRLGYPDGLKGPNCRHDYYPRFDWQTPIFSEQDLKDQAERDAKLTPYKWKDTRGVEHERDFTRRQALDRQRDMEVQMRKTRKLAAGYSAGGNREEVTAMKARYARQRKAYAEFSQAMGLKTDYNRVFVDGVGDIRKL